MCGNKIVCETDPKNDDYKYTEGAVRKSEQWKPGPGEVIETLDDDAKKRIASDPMYKLEHGEVR